MAKIKAQTLAKQSGACFLLLIGRKHARVRPRPTAVAATIGGGATNTRAAVNAAAPLNLNDDVCWRAREPQLNRRPRRTPIEKREALK